MKPQRKALAILLGTNKRLFSPLVIIAGAICVALLYVPHAKASVLSIKSDGTTAGYVTLGWTGSAGDSFMLQTKKHGAWVTLYSGPDKATTLTGLSNGAYLFRVSSDGSTWSDPVEVVVSHHPLWKAYSFFIGGLVLFIVLCSLLFLRPFPERNNLGQQTRSS